MTRPLLLTDDQMAVVLDAARPLPPHRHDAYLRDVANVLSTVGEIGPGSLHRAVRACVAKHFDPPKLDGGRGVGKNAR